VVCLSANGCNYHDHRVPQSHLAAYSAPQRRGQRHLDVRPGAAGLNKSSTRLKSPARADGLGRMARLSRRRGANALNRASAAITALKSASRSGAMGGVCLASSHC